MKVVAAFLLALLSGKASPGPDDIRNILGSVGAEVDEDKMDLFFKEIVGKDVNEVLAAGREKFASGGFGGGGGVAVAAAVGVGGGAAAPAAAEEKEEKKEEKEEESDDDMGFSLFD